MPIEVKELHIRVVVQETSEDTSEATLGSPGDFAVAGDTSHKPGGGAAGDDAPVEEVSFNYAHVEVQHTNSGGDFLFQADANAAGGGLFRAAEQDDPFYNGDGSVRFIRDSIDGGVWMGNGRDVLIGGGGADHIDAAASTNNRGLLLVGVDDLHLKAMPDGFDLV